ncbi:MAG: hypothetical protein L6R30_21350 [Thermoanaerobaculia bacterium]|nr:hypothetical protein [Thermoanaerobaculia bacterium]
MTDLKRFRLLSATFLFLAALWCGLMTAFALGAGIVLDLSPSRTAGGIVNRALLDALDLASIAVSVLLLCGLFAFSTASKGERGLMLRLTLLALAAGLISRFLITPRLWALREQMPLSMDLVPKESPLRKAWAQLHLVSLFALLVRILSAVALYIVAFGITPPKRTIPALADLDDRVTD